MGLNLLCKRECPIIAIHLPSGSCENLVSKHSYQYFEISTLSFCSDFATFSPILTFSVIVSFPLSLEGSLGSRLLSRKL